MPSLPPDAHRVCARARFSDTVRFGASVGAVEDGGHAANPIELILLRQLASYLTIPIFVADPAGRLLYYNEPAEALLGHRFEETGEMSAEEWGTLFRPSDAEGVAIPPERLPLVVAVRERRPTQGEFSICGLDGVSRHIVVVAFPIEGQHGRQLGGAALFWEEPT